jgi:Nif-specific regulatory protein
MGTIVPLVEPRLSIGRVRSNQLPIKSTTVSRQHCVIERLGDDRFKITDLGSHNGTFVNGVPRMEQWLDHGDEIRIGDSVFLLSLREEEPLSTETGVELKQDEVITESFIVMSSEEPLYSQPEGAPPSHLTPERLIDDLRALSEIAQVISSTRGVEALERRLLEAILSVVPAQRGAILLAGTGEQEFSSIRGWDRESGTDRPVGVSRTIVRRVLREGVSIQHNLAAGDRKDTASMGEMASGARSVLAVPLVAFETRFGVIYLESTDIRVTFDEGHLQLLASIAGVSAIALENARQMEWLGTENQRLLADLNIEHNMVGDGAAMRKVHESLSKVAPTDATVLIRGESGTGKELVARAIHRNSLRAAKPFVAINCAALVETLLESELFGHEKGAFTSAIAQKKGKLEVADGGTVFLDEISELAQPLQAKLLRVLQEHEFERVGGTRPLKVDIRIVAATSRDLKDALKSRDFREDLYYRLNVVSIEVPPLRERREDLPLLAMYFVAKYGAKCNRNVKGISPEARERLLRYDWPGNVRELENAIERAIVLGSSDTIHPEDLPESVLEAEAVTGALATKYHETILQAKKRLIVSAYKKAEGNHVAAARLMGVHPKYLHRLIRNLNLRATLKKS